MARPSAPKARRPVNDGAVATAPDSAGSTAPTAAGRWAGRLSFHHSRYTPARVAAERAARDLRVSVCLPARECAGTVGEIVKTLLGLREQGVLDEVVVVDAASADGTAAVAAHAGAVVHQQDELLPEFGPALGKGDAMWRALSVLQGELVCFLDADTEGFDAHFATGLLGPLVCEPGVSFVKAFYRRPLAQATDGGASASPPGGGRVNHLLARPALTLFYPPLAHVRQPLAGEVAARRELLESLPFATGYGVEIAMLIDVYERLGLDAIAQVDLEEHRNRHQPLSALAPMALTVLATIASRLEREGRLIAGERGHPQRNPAVAEHAPPERPPLAAIRIRAAAGALSDGPARAPAVGARGGA